MFGFLNNRSYKSIQRFVLPDMRYFATITKSIFQQAEFTQKVCRLEHLEICILISFRVFQFIQDFYFWYQGLQMADISRQDECGYNFTIKFLQSPKGIRHAQFQIVYPCRIRKRSDTPSPPTYTSRHFIQKKFSQYNIINIMIIIMKILIFEFFNKNVSKVLCIFTINPFPQNSYFPAETFDQCSNYCKI